MQLDKYIEKRSKILQDQMPFLLKVEHHHGDADYYNIKTLIQFGDILLDIYEQRLNEGCYDDDDSETYQFYLENNNTILLWDFLNSRATADSEGIEIYNLLI